VIRCFPTHHIGGSTGSNTNLLHLDRTTVGRQRPLDKNHHVLQVVADKRFVLPERLSAQIQCIVERDHYASNIFAASLAGHALA